MSQQLNVYSYYDAAGIRQYADFNDVVFTGTWSSTGTYLASAMQVVNYSQSQYLCVVDNFNKNPSTQPTKYRPTRYWSSFVLVIPGAGSNTDPTYQVAVSGSNIAVAAYGTASAAYLLAVQDLAIATSGSNQAVYASGLAAQALSVAQAGVAEGTVALNAAAAAQTTANGGFAVAVAGTNAAAAAETTATQAYNLAAAGTNQASGARAVASEALTIAIIGTNLGTAAFDLAQQAYSLAASGTDAAAAMIVANEAYALATTGTGAAATAQSAAVVSQAIADEALAIAVAGTNAAIAAQTTATTALTLAVSANNGVLFVQSLGTNAQATADHALAVADEALAIAIIGTEQIAAGGGAYTIAVAGTATANEALAIAIIGTNLGTSAYNLAQTAYNTAVAGTTAGAAMSRADSAYALAQVGTTAAASAQATATQAYVLAAAGTLPPALAQLTDVSLNNPTASQVLVWTGSIWTAQDAPSTSVPTVAGYFLDDTSSGTLGLFSLLAQPSTIAEQADTVSASGGVPVFIEGYLSGPLNRTLIDSGIWEFDMYASVSQASRPAQIITDIYTLSNAGVATYLFSGTSQPVNETTPSLTSYVVIQNSFVVAMTDKLMAKNWAVRAGSAVNVTVYHNGTAHYSHFHTPLRVAHNDLSGLQGGTTDQFYHITSSQNSAITGSTGGAPSASNPFVTNGDSRLATGTTAYTIAVAGTTAAAAAQATATAAYTVATSGTSAATAAQATATAAYVLATTGTGAASAAQTTANNALANASAAMVAQGTRVSLSGGTMTGNLVTPNIQTSVGTFPYVGASGGTITYSFLGPAYQRTTVDRNVAVTVSDMAPGREIAVCLESIGAGSFAVNVSSDILFFGATAPPSIGTNSILIAMASFGTNRSSVVAAYTVASSVAVITP